MPLWSALRSLIAAKAKVVVPAQSLRPRPETGILYMGARCPQLQVQQLDPCGFRKVLMVNDTNEISLNFHRLFFRHINLVILTQYGCIYRCFTQAIYWFLNKGMFVFYCSCLLLDYGETIRVPADRYVNLFNFFIFFKFFYNFFKPQGISPSRVYPHHSPPWSQHTVRE